MRSILIINYGRECRAIPGSGLYTDFGFTYHYFGFSPLCRKLGKPLFTAEKQRFRGCYRKFVLSVGDSVLGASLLVAIREPIFAQLKEKEQMERIIIEETLNGLGTAAYADYLAHAYRLLLPRLFQPLRAATLRGQPQ